MDDVLDRFARGERKKHYPSESDAPELIARILDWAVDVEYFDATFVSDLREKLTSGIELSERQLSALENIISRWDIP